MMEELKKAGHVLAEAELARECAMLRAKQLAWDAHAEGMSISKIANLLGITRQTIYTYIQENS